MPNPDSKNIFSLAEDLQQKRSVVTSLPPVIYVESVYGCPYSCIMCDVRELKPRLISEELLKKLEPLYPHLYLLAVHGDGEPLLGNQIDYYINVSRENNIMLHMDSTGFFLTPDLTERLLKGTKLSIRFSVHAGTERAYARIMGHDLEQVKKNIRYLVERNSEIGDRDNEFWFSYIVMKENIDEIPDFLHLASQLGIRQVRFMKLIPNRLTIKGVYRKKDNFMFCHSEQYNNKIKKEFLNRVPEIKVLALNLNITVEPGDLEFDCKKISLFDNAIIQKLYNKFFPIAPKGTCLAPWIGGCIIKQNGDVILCCGSRYVIGNLFKSNFSNIWNSARMQNIRKKFASGRLLKYCAGCRTVQLEEYPKTISRELMRKLFTPKRNEKTT